MAYNFKLKCFRLSRYHFVNQRNNFDRERRPKCGRLQHFLALLCQKKTFLILDSFLWWLIYSLQDANRGTIFTCVLTIKSCSNRKLCNHEKTVVWFCLWKFVKFREKYEFSEQSYISLNNICVNLTVRYYAMVCCKKFIKMSLSL